MKKIVLSIILFIMFIPVFVMAETCEVDKITIESITVDNKTGTANEKRDAVVDDKTIDLDISMNNPGDSITYKLTVKNDSSEDFELDKNSLNANSTEYIYYTFSENDNSVIIKAKSTKDVYLKIEYENEIPFTVFNNGTYSVDKTVALNLSTKESIINPPTGVKSITLVILILLSISIISYLVLHNNPYLKPFIIILGLIIIPIGINAACKCDIVVNSSIEIKKIAEFETGQKINTRMETLADYKYKIKSFRRSSTLPDDIKTLVDSQIEEVKNVNITEEELSEEFEYINSNYWVMPDFSSKEVDGKTYYCTNNEQYCDSEDDYKSWLRSDFCYLIDIGNNQYNYLTYIESLDEVKLLTEEEFLVRLREKLLKEKKNDTIKNVFSSSKSDYIIYGWYDDYDEAIYYYCENEEVYLNKDSSNMFSGLESLTSAPGIENVNTSNVKTMESMFNYAGSYSDSIILDVSNWDVSNVKYATYLFNNLGYEASECNVGDLSNWNTSNIINMEGIFNGICRNANEWNIGNLDNWNTSKVTSMAYLFNSAGMNATIWNAGDLSNWDTSNVTTMDSMFNNAGSKTLEWNIGDLSNWDTSNVESMYSMFSYAGRNSSEWSVGNISNWDTSNVAYMNYMFSNIGINVNSLNLDLSNWDTSSLKEIYAMFASTGYDAETVTINVSNWDTSNVTNMSDVFAHTGMNAKTINLDASNWTINNTQIYLIYTYMGENAETINFNMSGWYFPTATSIVGSPLDRFGRNAENINIDMSNWNLPNISSAENLFTGLGYNIENISVDLSNWNIPKMTSMKKLFYNSFSNSGSVNIVGLSTWDVSNVTNMNDMFYMFAEGTTNINIGDLSTWNLSNVTSMDEMFGYFSGKTSGLLDIGTINVYADNISRLTIGRNNIKAIINIHTNPTTYNYAFRNAATEDEASIVVNYTSDVTNIDNIINTKTSGSHVVKGELISE